MEWRRFQDEAPTEQQIRNWWSIEPEANIALVLGRGVFALDIDDPQGHKQLQAHGIKIPPSTPTSMTSRGVHYLFKGDYRDRIGLLTKVDMRGQGIIVVPPSIHESGHQYRWLCPPDRLSEPPHALQALLSRVVHIQVASNRPGWVAEALAGVSEGLRNAMCAKLAGYFLAKNIEREAVEQILLAFADRCSPKLETHEVLRTVKSIAFLEARQMKAHGNWRPVR